MKDVHAEYVAHPALSALSQHDQRNGTELLQTLAVFIRCRYNATRAASELYVARSTLLNRLERIVDITGIDFNDSDDLVYLLV